MSEDYKAKVFKSGNSLALRLPKALGLEEGAEMRLREEHGRFTFEPVDAPRRKITGEGWMGMLPDLQPLSREERELEDSPRVWDDPAWPDWRNKTS